MREENGRLDEKIRKQNKALQNLQSDNKKKAVTINKLRQKIDSMQYSTKQNSKKVISELKAESKKKDKLIAELTELIGKQKTEIKNVSDKKQAIPEKNAFVTLHEMWQRKLTDKNQKINLRKLIKHEFDRHNT